MGEIRLKKLTARQIKEQKEVMLCKGLLDYIESYQPCTMEKIKEVFSETDSSLEVTVAMDKLAIDNQIYSDPDGGGWVLAEWQAPEIKPKKVELAKIESTSGLGPGDEDDWEESDEDFYQEPTAQEVMDAQQKIHDSPTFVYAGPPDFSPPSDDQIAHNLMLDLQLVTDEQQHNSVVIGFITLLLGAIRLFAVKNLQYGPTNISGFGEVGVLVRASDKFARLKNMSMKDGQFVPKKDPGVTEPYADAWMDLANYSIIALMCLRGWWPGVVADPAYQED